VEYPLFLEQKNGIWRAYIPALAGLSVEGASREEAVRNAKRAAEEYLTRVEVTTVEVNLPIGHEIRPDSPQALLKALEAFSGDGEAMREHFEEIAKERKRQREEAQRDGAE
jgi:predicted RNase H-like HicB family nuclease